MSGLALALIVFSALMHAVWNLLVKRSSDKTVFIWWMFVCSGSLLNLLVWLQTGQLPRPPLATLVLALGAACSFVAYHWCNGVAYSRGDLSLAYPLSQTSMIYTPLWAVLFLGEQLRPGGIVGILLVLVGAYAVQLPDLTRANLLRPLRNLGQPAVRAALLAGLIYSVGVVLDKLGITSYSPLYFTQLLVTVMLVLMTLNLLRPCYRGRVLACLRRDGRLIALSGPVMLGSFLSFRYGLSLAPVSYAVPVRQVSLLFGVLFGVLCLHESCGRIRFGAALLILVGVCFIRLGG
ncbi:EamA family transporter [Desulfuromonas thiophila]|uniref:Uncharacterized membrane protein n=1 Tax=Desulfuromonas thiophila TaxID=57664 RepID=A0A1G6ZV20_9BACT|nr:EamA family transporter [Desulfuromonas thiophila]SDE06087.1 Uncharacterized membrane protein [Desulfuromonas thiophila]